MKRAFILARPFLPARSLGLLSPVTDRNVVGLEGRAAFLKGRPGVVDPTFGPGVGTETIWTVKVSWALVY